MFYIVFIIGLLLTLLPQKKLATQIYAVILILMASFRYGCGPDYFAYEDYYSKAYPSFIAEFSNPNRVCEIGYRLLEAFIKQFNVSYQGFIAITAIIGIFFIYKTSVKYSSNPILSFVVYYTCYYFVWTYSSLRQGLAMTIGIFYLLEAIKENKDIKFFIITLSLCLLHTSAIVLVILYIISKINLSKIQLIIIILFSLMINFLPLTDIVMSLTQKIPVLARMNSYLNIEYSINKFFDFKTAARLVFMLIAFVFFDKYTENSLANKKILTIYIISFAFYFAFKFSELTAARLAVYGKLLDILILPGILYTIKPKWNKAIIATFLVLLLFAYMVKELINMEITCGIVDSTTFITQYVHIFNNHLFFTK